MSYLRGAAAAALVSMCFAATPVAQATVLVDTWRDSGTTKTVVLLGVAVAVVVSLIIGLAFLPTYLLGRRRLLRGPVPHMIWGIIVVGTVLFVLYNPRHQTFTPRDIVIAAVVVIGGGAAEGFVFWKGAFPEA
jgi:hypothetical protein